MDYTLFLEIEEDLNDDGFPNEADESAYDDIYTEVDADEAS